MLINSIYSSFLDMVFPKFCLVCDEILSQKEDQICWSCLVDLETTDNYKFAQNELTDLLANTYLIHKAASYYHFKKDGVLQKMIHDLKYNNNREIGSWLGQQIGVGLASWLEEFDMIIPVPIHKRRRVIRGYNQAEVIAQGLSKETSKPVETNAIKKKIHNDSQTNKSKLERLKNVSGVFEVQNSELIEGMNILLLDDIITTGSTILSCISEIYEKSRPRKVSVLIVASQEYL